MRNDGDGPGRVLHGTRCYALPSAATADPWHILGLPAGSSIDEARAARKRLAKQLHPDLHGDDSPADRAERTARMTLVNRALAEIEEGGPVAEARSGDGDSFSLPWLPADAFEALFLVSYGLGDILSTDEPYRLELYLNEPAPCFCRLRLMPEAGATLVLVDIEAAADSLVAPTATEVIEALVSELDRLTPDP